MSGPIYPLDRCHCYRCTKARCDASPQPEKICGIGDVRMMRMFLCETCGNKRCPHAADHAYACTHSNEPGQKGSLYEDAQPWRTDEPKL